MPAEHQVMVVGQIARDLVLEVKGMPTAGSAAAATQRLEMLGGKGANQYEPAWSPSPGPSVAASSEPSFFSAARRVLPIFRSCTCWTSSAGCTHAAVPSCRPATPDSPSRRRDGCQRSWSVPTWLKLVRTLGDRGAGSAEAVGW
jgi:hypothetical protein